MAASGVSPIAKYKVSSTYESSISETGVPGSSLLNRLRAPSHLKVVTTPAAWRSRSKASKKRSATKLKSKSPSESP
eukprot:11193401-Lingulodinium_polyedra.AAC.1